MWTKVFSWVSSFVSSSSLGAYLLIAAVGFGCGVYTTADHYKAKIENMKAELLAAAQKETKDYVERLTTAISERDAAYSRIQSLVASDSYMRNRLLDANNRETARVAANPGKSYAVEYNSCRKLLQKSLDLAGEGCGLVGKCAADKDAVVRVCK